MDRQHLIKHNIIERFVLNQLNDKELDDFLVFQMQNPGVRQEVMAKREEMKAIRAAGRYGLDDSGKKGGSKPWIGLLIIGLIIAFGWFLWQQNSTTTSVASSIQKELSTTTPDETPQNKILTIDTTAVQPEIKKEPIPEKPKTIKKQPKKPQIAPKKKAVEQKEKKPINQPIAANFEPIEDLELMIGNRTRSEGYVSELDVNLTVDTVYRRAVEMRLIASLQVHGKFVNADSTVLNEKFSCYLFSNDQQAFQNFTPIEILPVPLIGKESTYFYELKIEKELPTGLYYWIIENDLDEDIFEMGKIIVL